MANVPIGQSTKTKILSFGPLILIAVYLCTPLIFSVNHLSGVEKWTAGSPQFVSEIVIAYGLAVSGALISITLVLLLSVFISTLLTRLWPPLIIGLLPLLLGSAIFGFLGRITISGNEFLQMILVNRSSVAVFVGFVVICVLRFFPPFVFLMTSHFASIPQVWKDYAVVAGMTRTEFLRDVQWPLAKGLALVLLCFLFFTAINQGATYHKILTTGNGAGIETVEGLQEQTFRIQKGSSHENARSFAIVVSATIFGANILLALFTIPIQISLVTRVAKLAGNIGNSSVIRKSSGALGLKIASLPALEILVVVCVCLMTLFPLCQFIARLTNLETTTWNPEIWTFFIFAFLPSIVIVAIAAVWALALRIAFKCLSRSSDVRTTRIFTALCVGNAVPAIAFYFVTSFWASQFESSGPAWAQVGWFLGMISLVCPLVTMMFLWVMFAISDEEFRFLAANRIGYARHFCNCWARRFRLEILLVFIFTYSLILTESIINSRYVDTVPNVAAFIRAASSAKNANNEEVAYLVLATSVPIFMFLIAFGIAQNRRKGDG